MWRVRHRLVGAQPGQVRIRVDLELCQRDRVADRHDRIVRSASMRALVVQHEHDGPAGLVGERLRARGYDVVDHLVMHAGSTESHHPFPDPTAFDVVVPLGSIHGVYEHDVIGTWIDHEIAMLPRHARRRCRCSASASARRRCARRSAARSRRRRGTRSGGTRTTRRRGGTRAGRGSPGTATGACCRAVQTELARNALCTQASGSAAPSACSSTRRPRPSSSARR